MLLQLSSSLSPWDPAPFESPRNRLRWGSPRPPPPRPRRLRVAASRLPCRPPRGPRRSVPAPPVAAAPAPAAQAAAPSLPPPTPVLTPGRLPGRVSVCATVLGRRPVRGGGGRLRAGGSREQGQPPPPGGARSAPERTTGAGLAISPAHRGLSSHPRLLSSSARLQGFLQTDGWKEVPFVKFSLSGSAAAGSLTVRSRVIPASHAALDSQGNQAGRGFTIHPGAGEIKH